MVLVEKLRFEAVVAGYGARKVLNHLNFAIHAGEIVGLQGINGCGKSTTLQLAAGLMIPTSGNVTLCQKNTRTRSRNNAQLFGYAQQHVALYEELSVARNLQLFGSLYSLSGKQLQQKIAQLLDCLNLKDRSNDRVRNLSGGMQRRVHLACAMLHQPQVLLLDEPTAALDEESRELFLKIFSQMKENGVAILMTTHQKDEALLWCDRVLHMENGSIVEKHPHKNENNLICLVGLMPEPLDEIAERRLRDLLAPEVQLELNDRHFRLSAFEGDLLGFALSWLYSEQIQPEMLAMCNQATAHFPAPKWLADDLIPTARSRG
ncbi:MAG: heme ABC exporter ATP-binding protein CcmA [Zavarzinella sp.]